MSRPARDPRPATPFESLVTRNPMLVEIRRATRRYLTFSGANGTVTFGLLIGIIAYAILCLLVINLRGGFHPKIVLGLQMFIGALVAPITLHASIAGERERRTWDMLMVAPVTHAQVVVGKLLGGIAVQVAIAAALFIPAAISALTYSGTDGLSVYGFLRLELVSISGGAFCCALTMLISARVKRAFVALGVSFSALLLLFAFFPMIIASAGVGGSNEMNDLAFGWHPAYALFGVDSHRYDYSTGATQLHDGGIIGWPQTLAMLAFTAIFTAWTVRTVAFADNEVKFLPGQNKRKKNA